MSMNISFVKMQGTGNDFIMVDARRLDLDWPALAIEMCRLHFGVGADGLILIQDSKKADLKMRIFNADGSEAQICGNGLRCFAKYAVDRKIVRGPALTVDTLAGIKKIETTSLRGSVGQAQVNMGMPELSPDRIPVSVKARGPVLDHPVKVAGRELKLSFVSMGNPHAVCFIKQNVDNFPLSDIGPKVEHHKLFPQRTNFEIVNVVDKNTLKARVWERGVGETLACGSGACAVAVASRLKGLTGNSVNILVRGGKLTITWAGKGDVYLKGPAEEVYEGEYKI